MPLGRNTKFILTPMKAVATAMPQSERKSWRAQVSAAQINDLSAAEHSQYGTVQRKALCACGGGCPSCESKRSDLKVSQPHDAAELEADAIADKVMRMPDQGSIRPIPNPNRAAPMQSAASPLTHRKSSSDENETIRPKPLSSNGSVHFQSPEHVRSAISSGGRPLDRQTRRFFEPKLGYDLSHVRIHTDATASQSAGAIDAKAFTLGKNIVFGNGEYKPESESGKHLLAHELAHVVQTEDGPSDGSGKRQIMYRKGTTPQKEANNDDKAFSVEIDHGHRGIYLIHFTRPHPEDEVKKILFTEGTVPTGYKLEYLGVTMLGWDWRFSTSIGNLDIGTFQKLTPEFGQHFRSDVLGLTPVESVAYREREETFLSSRPIYLDGQSVREAFQKCKDHKVGSGCWGKRAGYFYYIGFQTGYTRRALEVRSSPQLKGIIRDWEWWLNEGYTLHDAARAEEELQTWILQQTVMAFAGALSSAPGAVRRPMPVPAPIGQVGRIISTAAQDYVAIKMALGKDITETDMIISGVAGLAEAGTHFLTNKSTRAPGLPSGTPYSKAEAVAVTEPSDAAIATKPVASRHRNVVAKPAANDNFANDMDRMRKTKAAKLSQQTRQTKTAQIPLAATGTGDVAPVKVVGDTDATTTGEAVAMASGKTPIRIKPDTVTARPTGTPSDYDTDTLSQPGIRRQSRSYPSAPQHHVFPQELKKWFEERFAGLNEDIDEYTVFLSEGEHQAIHKAGKGGVVKGVVEPDLKGWNQEWKDFKGVHPKATPQEIFEEAGRLMKKYKIDSATIDRYRRTK
jgi:hypothetical protein